jgi:hypothetical protein
MLDYRPPKCRECGRFLKAFASISRGFGSTCALTVASKWLTEHPKYLAPRARKLWTAQEIRTLAKSTIM